MAIDRWYPTLTALPDGRVLISSGASRVAGGHNRLEIFDPSDGSVILLDADYPDPSNNGMPLYPFMFVLPTGDILYAGAEGASATHSKGRVLLADYDGGDDDWEWYERVFESSINGGSAVMYEPGKIMKSGGLAFDDDDETAIAGTEIIDLSNVDDCGGYDNAPDFVAVAPMNEARHFHTLTLLPDGRVLASGGNRRGNSMFGDHTTNECEYEGVPIASHDCDLSCPGVPSRCLSYDPDGDGEEYAPGTYCPFLNDASCTTSLDCGSECITTNDCPPGSTCNTTSGRCEMPCNSGTCGAVMHCTS